MNLGPNKFNEEGFNDWKNANIGLCRHEESKSHKKAIIDMIGRKKKGERVDTGLIEQIESDQSYWKKVLKRVAEVIKFLAERGLPFRGGNETNGSVHNGNYIGVLELLAKFDPFLVGYKHAWEQRARSYFLPFKRYL